MNYRELRYDIPTTSATTSGSSHYLDYEKCVGLRDEWKGIFYEDSVLTKKQTETKLSCPKCGSTTFVLETVSEVEILARAYGCFTRPKNKKITRSERRTMCKYCHIEVDWKKTEKDNSIKLNG